MLKNGPQNHEFGEVFGAQMGPRSKNFRFKVDTKIELTFYMILKRFLYDSEAQDGAKMAPRWRQDEAKMASKCYFKSCIVPPLDFFRFWRLPGPLWTSIFIDLGASRATFLKIFSTIFCLSWFLKAL